MWQATDPAALDPLLERIEFEHIERALTKSFQNKAPPPNCSMRIEEVGAT